MNRDLFIFVPAYSVERELGALLRSIPGEVLLRTREILIVDDGSSDGTGKIAEDFSQCEIRTRVRIETFEKNEGYGAVVKCGISRALALSESDGVKFAVCLHGDGQYPAKAVLRMLPLLQQRHICINVLCRGRSRRSVRPNTSDDERTLRSADFT